MCRGLVGAMLFAQLAIAAYACPALSPGIAAQPDAALAIEAGDGGGGAVASALAGTPSAHCDDIVGALEPRFANLCAGQCQHGQQNSQPSPLQVPPGPLMPPYGIAPACESGVARRIARAEAATRTAGTPPHAILHCCFRL